MVKQHSTKMKNQTPTPGASLMQFSSGKIISTCIAAVLLLTSGSLQAVNVTKLDTTSMASSVVNWSAAPAAADIGQFTATPSSGTPGRVIG